MDALGFAGTMRLVSYSGTILIIITILIYTFIQTRLDKLQNKLFMTITSIVFINAATLLYALFAQFAVKDVQASLRLMNTAQTLYFFAHTMLCPMFGYYVTAVTGKTAKYSKKFYIIYAVPYLLCEALVLLNPFLHWVFRYDAEKAFYRGPAEMMIYIIAAGYFIYSVASLFLSWNALTRQRRYSLVYFFGVILAGILIQLLFVSLKTELFCEALALVGVMLTIENEDSRLDADTGIYNRSAFKMDLNSYIANRQAFRVLCIKITNSDIVQRVTGSANTDSYVRLIGEYIKALVPRYTLYHVNPMTYAMTFIGSRAPEAESTAYKILDRFELPWKLKDSEVVLHIAAVLADVPGHVSRTGEILYIADNQAPPNAERNLIKDDDLGYFMRRIAVEHSVMRGIEEHNFEVYYQPTYTIDEKLHGAEALLRLHDPELGNVFPDEFIPAAERMGLIDNLDEFVLEEVCWFIKSGVPSGYGMESINVNLSVIQCMRPGFVGRILDIVEKTGADKSMINFEITESVSSNDYGMLSSVVHSLKDNGFVFAMDDYGTGYSNMQSIFSIDFDVVKIDKSILWGAEKSEMGMIILRSSVSMIKEMKKRILVEGVETREQIELLRALDVDFLQGYYFSKPLPKSKLLELLEKER